MLWGLECFAAGTFCIETFRLGTLCHWTFCLVTFCRSSILPYNIVYTYPHTPTPLRPPLSTPNALAHPPTANPCTHYPPPAPLHILTIPPTLLLPPQTNSHSKSTLSIPYHKLNGSFPTTLYSSTPLSNPPHLPISYTSPPHPQTIFLPFPRIHSSQAPYQPYLRTSPPSPVVSCRRDLQACEARYARWAGWRGTAQLIEPTNPAESIASSRGLQPRNVARHSAVLTATAELSVTNWTTVDSLKTATRKIRLMHSILCCTP